VLGVVHIRELIDATRSVAAHTCLVVADDGPGMPEGAVLRRGSRAAGSTGLGLDIVARSGGGVWVGRSGSGGAEVRVNLGPPDRALP